MSEALSLFSKTDGKNFLNQADTFSRILTCRIQKHVAYLALPIM